MKKELRNPQLFFFRNLVFLNRIYDCPPKKHPLTGRQVYPLVLF